MTTDEYIRKVAAIIKSTAEEGGRIVIQIGDAERTMTFKPGLTPEKIDEIIANAADSMGRELAEKRKDR